MSIITHWFYLLSKGGIDKNENGDSYIVTGIGIDKAAKIVYQAHCYEMEQNMTFSKARYATILAAEKLFPESCQEVESVTNAWYAVGVGDIYEGTLSNEDITTNKSLINCIIRVENVTVESSEKLIVNGEFHAEFGSELEFKTQWQ